MELAARADNPVQLKLQTVARMFKAIPTMYTAEHMPFAFKLLWLPWIPLLESLEDMDDDDAAGNEIEYVWALFDVVNNLDTMDNCGLFPVVDGPHDHASVLKSVKQRIVAQSVRFLEMATHAFVSRIDEQGTLPEDLGDDQQAQHQITTSADLSPTELSTPARR